MMAAADFDVIFTKALRLLHSKSKDSADQLRAMLDEALAQRQGNAINQVKQETTKKVKYGIETSVIKSGTNVIKRESEKRVEKVKTEPVEPVEKKKLKLDSINSRSSSPTLPITEPEIKKEEDSETTDIEEEPTDACELAFEMGLACVICKQIGFAQGNQLVECQECHNLYHQECHKPPATDQDVNDPRLVWYCAKCTKSLNKKIIPKPTKGTNKPGVALSSNSPPASHSKEPTPTPKNVKTEVSSSIIQQPFKRVESKVSGSVSNNNNNSSTTNTKPIGLAALAANINKTGGNNSAGNSGNKGKSNNGQGSSGSVSSTVSSDKRIQIMKKKAKNNTKSK